MRAVPKTTSISIDERLAEYRRDNNLPERVDEPTVYVEVEAFGEMFRIAQSMNAWGIAEMMDEEEGGGIHRFVMNRLHPEDRPRWRRVMGMQVHLSVEELGIVVDSVMQAVTGEVPTRRPNGSGPSARKRAAITRSAEG
jgi:hypothetical protein